MIVITLSKVPPSLRGDLTKWYQEIQTGVYVGNVSARIRDALWIRIQENIGRGEATMVYNARNEFGYEFKTTRTDRAVVDYDGLPLLMHLADPVAPVKLGFSDAAKRHQAVISTKQKRKSPDKRDSSFVVVDIETTGLSSSQDQIIALGVVKYEGGGKTETLERLIKTTRVLPAVVTKLTGLSNVQLEAEGESLQSALSVFVKFIGEYPLLGYNVRFDEEFIDQALADAGIDSLQNQVIDLIPAVKKAERFLDNLRLETVLAKFEIENTAPHHALADAMATYELAMKLIDRGKLTIPAH